jgi:hypothetical protein
VLCHELFHKINGDLFVRGDTFRQRNVWNIAFDIVINSTLCRQYFKKPIPLLDKMYTTSTLPIKLLSHPDYVSLDQLLDGVTDTKLAQLAGYAYSSAWSEKPAADVLYETVSDIFNLLYGKDEEPDLLEFLLGDHSLDKSKFNDWLRRLFKSMLPIPGKGDSIEKQLIIPDSRKSGMFYDIVHKAISPSPLHQTMKDQLVPERGFIPFPGRKEIFYLSSGYYPQFYPNMVTKRDFNEWRTVVYLDVSGSTMIWWEVAYGLLINLKELIGDKIYLFSDTVEELDFDRFKIGEVVTSGGTNFNAVCKHAVKNKYKRILIISDGVGYVSSQSIETSKSIEVFVVLTQDRWRDGHDLVQLAGGPDKQGVTWWSLPAHFNN